MGIFPVVSCLITHHSLDYCIGGETQHNTDFFYNSTVYCSLIYKMSNYMNTTVISPTWVISKHLQIAYDIHAEFSSG